MFDGQKLVAFRTFFADMICASADGKRFGWCSGNWVHPLYRRMGWSFKMLNQAHADWQGRLMFTNYAPESEKLYLKSGMFKPIHSFSGVRAYLYYKVSERFNLNDKNILHKTIAKTVDGIAGAVARCSSSFFRHRLPDGIRFDDVGVPDDQCYKLVEKSSMNPYFCRGRREMEWILRFPWISAENRDVSFRYPFSSWSETFHYHTIKIFERNAFKGFFIFSMRNRKMKTLFFAVEPGLEDEIASFIKDYAIENKIEVITIYNSPVAGQLFKRKFPFLHVKKYGQRIYSSFMTTGSEGFQFQDGDGDVFFT